MSRDQAVPPASSAIPVIGHTVPFARDPFGFVRQAVDEVGDLFRLRLASREVYVVANPDLVRTVLTRPETFAKPDDFKIAFGDAVLSVHGDQWRRQRGAMEGLFSPDRIADYGQRMSDITADRIAGWHDGEDVQLDDEMRSIALENLFEVILGAPLTAEEVDSLADAASDLNLYFKPSTWALPDWLPTPAAIRFRRGKATLRERAGELIESIDDPSTEDGLIAKLAMLEAKPDSGFDRKEVLDQVVGMLFAGHETTALAMTYGLHQIAAHDDITDRFYTELSTESGSGTTIADPTEAEYLDQIIHETLRLYPPVHTLPRVTTERVELGDYVIPADKDVQVAIWAIHHDPRFYTDPWTFDPARWAGTTPQDRGHAFIPFGGGPRTCLGRHFAHLEMKSVFTTIARQYRLDAEGHPTVSPQMTSQPKNPVTATVYNYTGLE